MTRIDHISLDAMDGLGEFRDTVLGLSQAEVARKAGVSASRISMLESGCIPKKRRTAQKYIRAYGMEKFPNSFFVLAQRGIK